MSIFKRIIYTILYPVDYLLNFDLVRKAQDKIFTPVGTIVTSLVITLAIFYSVIFL